MATISAADLTLLRQQRQSARLYLSILQPATLLAARVNNIAIARGDRSIAYDTGTGSGFATIEAGHTLLVGTAAGDYDVGIVRVKAIAGAQAAGTITVDENGIDWVDDLYLTVLHEYRIWPVPPRIDRSTGIFYKFYSTAYTDENSEPNPVALVGFPTYAGFLSGGTIAIALDAGNSYVTAQGAAIASYAWVCVHNGGSTANISFSDTATNTSAIQNPTLTISAADTYWLKLTVTDDNGKTQSTYRPLFIYADSTGPYRNFTVSNLSGDWNSAGWSFNVEIFGDVELSDFPDGTFALLWYQNYFNAVEDYVNLWDNSNEIVCSGYIQRETDDDDLAETGTGNVSFTVVSPAGVLANKSISPGAVELEAVTSPTTWYQYAIWLTAGRAVHHLLKWQSTVMETCEVIGLLNNTVQVHIVIFTEDSLLDMINNFAYEIGHFAKLCANRLGELHFVSDIQYYNDADRAAEDTIFSITAQDLSGTIQLARAPVKTTAFAFLDGKSFDGTLPEDAFTFGIPAYTDSIGVLIPEIDGRGSINKTEQILASETDGQEKCGRVLAVANNPLREMRLDLRANYLGAFDIIPNQGWYSWGLADADLKRSLSLNSTKWLCRRVEIRQTLSGDLFSGDITTGVVLEGEAFGPDGVTLDYPTDYPTPTLPTPNWTIGDSGTVYDVFTELDSFEFDSNTINEVLITNLTDTDAFIFYQRDLGGGNLKLYGTVVRWDGVSISQIVAPTLLHDIPGQGIALGRMSSSHVICTYRIPASDSFYGFIVEIAGAAFNTGAPVQIDSGNNDCNATGDISVISAAYSITSYEDTGGGFVQILETDGGMQSITTNTAELIDAAASSLLVSHIATGTAIVAYNKSGDGRCKTVNYVNDAITNTGTETTFVSNSPGRDIERVDNTHGIISFVDSDNADYPTICILTLTSATTISAATPVAMNNDAASNICQVAVFNSFASGILYDTSASSMEIQLIDTSATPAVESGSAVEITAGIDFGDVTLLSNNIAAIAFGDANDTNQGKVVIGALS